MPVWTRRRSNGRKQTASPVRPAACWSCLVRMAQCRARCSGWAKAMTNTQPSAWARWPALCPRATGISRRSPAIRRLPRSASSSAPINSCATARRMAAHFASRCRKVPTRARVERVCDAVFLTRDLINTPTNDMGPDALEAGRARAGGKAQGQGLGGQGRRAAHAEFPDDPCRRPRLGRGAAADRYALGRARTRPR